MAVETDAMRLQYLKDFGVSDATFRDMSAGTTVTIQALLRKKYIQEEARVELGVESSTPFALVCTSDVPNVVQGDQITINGTTYTIWAVEPDSEGMSDLRLRV